MAAHPTVPPAPVLPPVSPFFHNLSLALSGDPVMLRSVAATLGSFSMRLLVAGLILAGTLWASRRLGIMARGAIGRMNRSHPADTTLQSFVGSLTQYLVVVIGAIAVLQQLGVQATSVIAVLGAASLAIGLALQGALTNVAAGVMILLLRPYRVGDSVGLNGKQGTVTGLDLFNTRLIDPDGLTLHMPNGKVFGDMIVNYSQSGRRRVDLTFGIDYEDDLDLALQLLLEIAKADPRVMAEPPPWSKVTELQDSSVGVTVRCWTKPTDWLNTKFDITKQVKETFEANGLSFPYPHQVAVDYTPKGAPPRPAASQGVARQ